MFMHAILPQERLQVLIDKPVDTIDFLDGRALHRQTLPRTEAEALRRFLRSSALGQRLRQPVA
jgi:hypothetical protein